MIADGYTGVPPGRIAAVVTSLEMRERPRRPASAGRAEVMPAGLSLRHVTDPDPDWYRELFIRIGADWLWFARLRLERAALAAVIRDPDVQVMALARDGLDEGLLELDFRQPGECEIAYLGVTASLIGAGAGRLLMRQALDAAWSRPIARLWVHTCTLDHHGALGFYLRSGFVPFKRQVEVAEDPRLSGLLPETAAAHIPLIRKPA